MAPVLFDDREQLPALAAPARELSGPRLGRAFQRPDPVFPRQRRHLAGLDCNAATAGPPRPLEQAQDLAPDLLGVGVESVQHFDGHSLVLAHEPEQNVLGPDVVVAKLERLPQ
jgi:hypothetical protein